MWEKKCDTRKISNVNLIFSSLKPVHCRWLGERKCSSSKRKAKTIKELCINLSFVTISLWIRAESGFLLYCFFVQINLTTQHNAKHTDWEHWTTETGKRRKIAFIFSSLLSFARTESLTQSFYLHSTFYSLPSSHQWFTICWVLPHDSLLAHFVFL